MSITLAEPCRHGRTGSKEEKEIREIFYQHWEKMKDQMKAVIDGINVWRSRSIQEICSYADEQVRILKYDYEQQRSIFDKKREENLEIAKAYRDSKQIHLFNDLRNACRLLEFQVAQLKYIQDQKERPIVITVGDQTRNEGNIARSSSKTVSSVSNEIHQWPLMTPSSNVNDRSTDSNNTWEAYAVNDDDSNNKCPVCFMIFPLSMTRDDRNQHVNEHMIDGQDTNNITV